ncbi:hypothetical protein ALT721_440152 [Alteromonas alvinellae]
MYRYQRGVDAWHYSDAARLYNYFLCFLWLSAERLSKGARRLYHFLFVVTLYKLTLILSINN